MRLIQIFFTFFSLFALCSCANSSLRESSISVDIPESPLEVLELLENNYVVYFDKPIDDIVQIKHLPILLKLIDSNKESGYFLYSSISQLPVADFQVKSSTLGDQAAYLIMSFMDGGSYPKSFSTSAKVVNKEQLKIWCKKHLTSDYGVKP